MMKSTKKLLELVGKFDKDVELKVNIHTVLKNDYTLAKVRN